MKKFILNIGYDERSIAIEYGATQEPVSLIWFFKGGRLPDALKEYLERIIVV